MSRAPIPRLVHFPTSTAILAVALAAVCASVASGQSAGAPVVRTELGDLQGTAAAKDVSAFKGIPYASPPVGDLRWRDPRPAATWQGLRKAESYGSACIQPPGLSAKLGADPGPLSEDCLYLNVWTPAPDPSARLPVLVWIHGGAYISGAGGVTLYDGSPLAAKRIVVVSFNYRLMQLGFFVHPALERETPRGPANFALLDQIAALGWVQRNITQFGGNPENVTIMGQSAGAKSVLALFASPLARGLFRRGIAMSSYALPDATRAEARKAGIQVADAVGLRGEAATADELRAVPAERFGQLTNREVSISPVPISGDVVLPKSIQDTFAAGAEAPLPLMLGNTSDDASVVSEFGVDPAKILAKLRAGRMMVRVLYPGVRDERELARLATRDFIFTMPVRWIADRHSRLAPVYRYYFDYTAAKQRSEFPSGVPHGSDIVYFLNTGDIYEGTRDLFTDEDRSFSQTVSGYVTSFARDGRPGNGGVSEWPKHDGKRDAALLLEESVTTQQNFLKRRLDAMIRLIRILDLVTFRR